MSEAERYLDQVDDMLQLLGLPPVWDPDETDDLEEYEEELSALQLHLCFPNLSTEERDLISDAARMARRVRHLTAALAEHHADRCGNRKQMTKDALASAQGDYKELTCQVEAYGLRTKLTDFQEQLLARVLNSDANT